MLRVKSLVIASGSKHNSSCLSSSTFDWPITHMYDLCQVIVLFSKYGTISRVEETAKTFFFAWLTNNILLIPAYANFRLNGFDVLTTFIYCLPFFFYIF